MNPELSFEAMPFEPFDGFPTPASERNDSELVEEFGRRSPWRRSRPSSPMPRARFQQPRVKFRPSKKPATLGPRRPKKPLSHPARFPRIRGRWPWGVIHEPYGVVTEPDSIEPTPSGSEYMRWVQSALNVVLGLRLPIHGIADLATRSAIRSFQQSEGLPVDGVVGPETERALIAVRRGESSRRGATGPNGSGIAEPSEPAVAPSEPDAAEPMEPAPTPPTAEFGFEWENFEEEFDDARKSAERAVVKSRLAAGQRDPKALADVVFFRRHPERGGRLLRADEHGLVKEWKAILRDVVLPELGHRRAPPATGAKIADSAVGATLAMAARKVPGLGITLEELLVRHRAESGGIPIEALLAFIRFEAGTRLFNDATAGKWNEKSGKYVPKFYELGVFQTPAGDHGCVLEGGKKKCKHEPPGFDVKNSQFGKGWRRFRGTNPTQDNWTDPTMQVRIGLWDLTSTAERVRTKFAALFPSKQSEWFLRMAVLYSFAAGGGATGAFLRKYKNELMALPEGRRWDFLRGKTVGRFRFNPDNVDKKMALAAKLRAVRGGIVTQPLGEP